MKSIVRRVVSLSCIAVTIVSLCIQLCGVEVVHAAKVRTLVLRTQSQKSSDIASTSALVVSNGILVRWESELKSDNLGFDVYRIRDGVTSKINFRMIPGAIFQPSAPGVRGNHSYAYLDRAGSIDSIYVVESISTEGNRSTSQGIAVQPHNSQLSDSEFRSTTDVNTAIASVPIQYPSLSRNITINGPLEDQWAVAGQPGAKITIAHDGWYRVTQQQIAAAGFNPTVDVRNLRLFADGLEVTIRTSKSSGLFISGDYFEFFGLGLDTPTTGVRTYYLIAGDQPGKRTLNPALEVLKGLPLVESSTPVRIPIGISFAYPFFVAPEGSSSTSKSTIEPKKIPSVETASLPANEKDNAPKPLPVAKKKPVKKKAKLRKTPKRHAHASSSSGVVRSFNSTVLLKEREIYFFNAINGDSENYFGKVISNNPIIQTLATPNADVSGSGTAQLEIALQGVMSSDPNHQVNVEFNGTLLGTLRFFGTSAVTQTFDIAVSQIQSSNTVRFTHLLTGDTSLVDYVKLTYPHRYSADNNSLRFTTSARPEKISDTVQTASSGTPARDGWQLVDGFSTPNILLIDYTDPYSAQATTPILQPSVSGYSILVARTVTPNNSKRFLYALPDTQFEQPVSVSFNQPSTLNATSNGADLLIISHKNFIPGLTPLVSLRQSQGFVVSTVDVEDVYDEFGYGMHGPQAIKEFLKYATNHWSRAPRYLLLVGDATYDPRNYEGVGDLDFVPTKLVDATFDETASDDWLTDFNNDGLAEIPVGRLPVATLAQTNLVVSKLVNFSPANVPQSAMLVADDPTGYFFNFEQANDQVQALIPQSITVLRVNRRIDGTAAARAAIISNFNSGQMLVHYSGHGTLNSWTGANIFTSTDANVATNGNKLSFVVVMDCLNGLFQDPRVEALAEALIRSPNGGAIAAFASSGLTVPDGQHAMSISLYTQLYGPQSIALGDAVKLAKASTTDIDVRRTWILFGDPTTKIR